MLITATTRNVIPVKNRLPVGNHTTAVTMITGMKTINAPPTSGMFRIPTAMTTNPP